MRINQGNCSQEKVSNDLTSSSEEVPSYSPTKGQIEGR